MSAHESLDGGDYETAGLPDAKADLMKRIGDYTYSPGEPVRENFIPDQFIHANFSISEPKVEIDLQGAESNNEKTQISLLSIAASGLARSLNYAKKLRRSAANAKDSVVYAPALVAANLTGRLQHRFEKEADDWYESRNNRKSLKVALGGIAVAAVAGGVYYYLNTKGIAHNPNPTRVHETVAQVAPAKPSAVKEALPSTPLHAKAAEKAAHHARHVVKAVVKVKNVKESLGYSGDTIWSHIQRHIQAEHPGLSRQKLIELTTKATAKTLHINHMSWGDATHMSVGDSFKLPKHL